jgi:hypothetical protein
MMDHPIERKKYGNALKERISQKFSMEKMLAAVQREYDK